MVKSEIERWPDKSLGRELPPGFRDIEDLYLQLPPVMDSDNSLIRSRNTSDTMTMQGIEYLMQYATGDNERFPFTPDTVHQSMGYAMHYDELRKLPQLWDLFKDRMLVLPKGREIIEIITSKEEYGLK